MIDFFAYLIMVVTPCETEDSTGCRWDAETQGNGYGTSFVTDHVGRTTHEITSVSDLLGLPR
jgi:hypothetical protein